MDDADVKKVVVAACVCGVVVVVGEMQVRDAFRERLYLSRSSIPTLYHSPWASMRDSGDERAWKWFVGFPRPVFNDLVTICSASFKINRGVGRPTGYDAIDALALTLCWLRHSITQRACCLWFGLTPSQVSRALTNGFDALTDGLKNHPLARVTWPSPAEIRSLSNSSYAHHGTIAGVWGAMDGLKTEIERPDEKEQREYYNGWVGCHCVSSVFVFDYHGRIRWYHCNLPGSWHDARVSRPVLDRAVQMEPGFSIVADSAFTHTGRLAGKIITPSKRNEYRADEAVRATQLNQVISSMRIVAEWGMAALQKTFRRLAGRLTVNHAFRARLWTCVVLLFNYHAARIGNQISTVYDPSYMPPVFSNAVNRAQLNFNGVYA